jgi:hypothetical protein
MSVVGKLGLDETFVREARELARRAGLAHHVPKDYAPGRPFGCHRR